MVIIFVSIAILILSFAHWAFYKTLVRFLGLSNPTQLLGLKIGLAILAVALVAGFILASRYADTFTRLIYTGAMTWLGFFYYLMIATIILWLIYGFSKIFSFSPDMKLFAGIFFGAALVVGAFGILNANIIRTTKINVSLSDLPEAWRSKTIVWVSDLHLGQIRNISFAQKIAQLSEAQKPDIIFIGGDLYDGVAANLDELAEPFGKIKAPQGIYFITGNHEEFSDREPYLAAIRRVGIRVLLNEKIEIDGVQIIGVDDRDSLNRDKFTEILNSVNISKFSPSILLKHTPLDLDLAAKAGVSMQISGHTHYGQIFPNNLITHFVYKGFDFGLKQFENMWVYISSGAGTWGPPLRVGANPEIVVIKFK